MFPDARPSGEFTTNWIAVQFPEGPRYDLGLIEFIYLIFFSALFSGWIESRVRPDSSWPLRFGLLRIPYLARQSSGGAVSLLWLDRFLLDRCHRFVVGKKLNFERAPASAREGARGARLTRCVHSAIFLKY